MKLEKTFATLMATLLALVEIKYEGKNVSPFDTHPTTMLIFSATLVINGILLIADGLPLLQLVHYAGIISKVTVYSRSLALIMLLLIVIPDIGWFVLALWIACLVKVVFEIMWPFAWEFLIQLWHQIKTVFLGNEANNNEDGAPGRGELIVDP